MNNKWISAPLPATILNPQADWLNETGDGGDWYPIVFRLSQSSAKALAYIYQKVFGGSDRTPAHRTSGRVGPEWTFFGKFAQRMRMGAETLALLKSFSDEPPSEEEMIDVIVLLAGDLLENLKAAETPNGIHIVEIGPGSEVNVYGAGENALVDDAGNSMPTDLRGDEVLVAIIDDGIAFAHERFRHSAHQTRIEYFWAMESLQKSGGVEGKEWKKADIDAWLRTLGDEEELIYRKAGLLNGKTHGRQPLAFARSHGTHVLDIAAGYDLLASDQSAVIAKRPIMAVQLPSPVVDDTSGSYTDFWLRMALRKIRYWADQLAWRIAHQKKQKEATYLPLVLNFSFGVFAGAKDGNSQLAQDLRQFIAEYRQAPGSPQCHVVLPAGNGFQAQSLAEVKLGPSGTSQEIEWRVLADDKTVSFMHLWLPYDPHGCTDQVAAALFPPRGGPADEMDSKVGHRTDWVKHGKLLARIYHQRICWNGFPPREWVVIAILATEPEDDGVATVPAGTWRVRITNKAATPDTPVAVMVQRGDSIPDYRRTGRQSYIESADYLRYDPVSGRLITEDGLDSSPIRRRGTLNAYSCANEPVVVGGYRWSAGTPADYSASGPVPSARVGPDLGAVSETSPALRGVLAAGTYSGSVVLQQGTSVAAPALVRALADEIAAGGDLDSLLRKVRREEAHCPKGPHGPYSPVDPFRLGAGRLSRELPPRYRQRILPET